MCTLCDPTNINTIIEFVMHVSGDGFNGGSDSYLQFRYTHAPSLLKLCIPPSNGIVRWWLFPEFGAELSLDNCTPTIILNNPVYKTYLHRRWVANTLVTNDAFWGRTPFVIGYDPPPWNFFNSSHFLFHVNPIYHTTFLKLPVLSFTSKSSIPFYE